MVTRASAKKLPKKTPALPKAKSSSRIYGHRGAAQHAPENTLASMKKAAALGAKWVEFDAKLTADGKVILLHDDTLDRTTTGKGPAAKQTAAQLDHFDAGSWFSADYMNEKIPSLEAVIDCLKTLGVGANVEIKPCPGREEETGRAVALLLQKRWPKSLPAPILSSFKAEALAGAQAVAPNLERAYLLDRDFGEWRDHCRQLKCTGLHVWHGSVTGPEIVQDARKAGLIMRVYTVNNLTRARLLLDWGVEGIVTDDLLSLSSLM